MEDITVGFLGSGMMATAMAKGLVVAGVVKAGNITASDTYEGCRQRFTEMGAVSTESNSVVAKNSTVVFIAVKPNDVAAVLASIKDDLTAEHLVVSIAAGVTIATLASLTPEGTRIVRVMPNTPCLVQQVAAGVAKGPSATEADQALVISLFSAMGTALAVPEGKLDAVTGLSGSGPAYGYLAIEALADGGVRAGLPRAVALKLAAQTMLGAATMVLSTGKHPGQLKDEVCSPGGTTIAGVHALETAGFRAALMDAVVAASARAAELGKPGSA